MFGKYLVSFLSITLLAACSSSKNKTDDFSAAPVINGGGANTDGSNVIVGESYSDFNSDGSRVGSVHSGSLTELVPGSQEELVATIGDRVFFNFNSAQISSSGQQTLRRQADWLSQNQGVNITIEGHSDERGTREFNLALSERRANSVKNFLSSLGIRPSRITTIGYGKEHPEYIGTSETSWSKNRRGVTVVN